MSEHPFVVTLRNRRRELGWSKSKVYSDIGMARDTFEKRENSGRFGALEQFDRWARFLGYKLTLTAIEPEHSLWS